MRIRILIADDHDIVTEGLQHMLGSDPAMEVVACARDGREAVAAAIRTKPDIILMDLSMPELNGLEATRVIGERCPAARVVVLSMHSEVGHVVRAMRAGAKGYILKRSAGREVLEAVRAVYAGKHYLPPELADEVLGYLVDSRATDDPTSKLSSRERQVLQMLAEGQSVVQIAAALMLSPKTIETYRARLMSKVGVKDLVSLVKFAIQHGIASL
jgi:DNA-binding NarL/FixJ family response regulator